MEVHLSLVKVIMVLCIDLEVWVSAI